jgi:hypothetical protein
VKRLVWHERPARTTEPRHTGLTDTDGGVTPQWLALREPADASARARGLVRMLAADLAGQHPIVVHDLGSGSGSQGRWLAPLLPGPQHWVLHDRDGDLLRVAEDRPPGRAADGAPVTLETRRTDLTELTASHLAGASLVTASALLDMLTADEAEHLVGCCVAVGCPALITLSVIGRVVIDPVDPWDAVLGAAFDDHQRRTTGGRTLLGPDAAAHAVGCFHWLGAEVRTRPSRWRLGAGSEALTTEWLRGWVGAACEQRPELAGEGRAYLERRGAALAAGRLHVTVHHLDLLARPNLGQT